MTDDEKQKRFEENVARLREKAKTDPKVRANLLRAVGANVGGFIAAKGLELPDDDDDDDEVPPEFAEGVREGYLATSMHELASKPAWYTDVPLLGRLFRALFRRDKTPEDP